MSGLRRTMTLDEPVLRVAAVKCCAVVLLACRLGAGPAIAQEKPVAMPDQASPMTTQSRLAATLEIGLPALASAITSDFPRRIATIDERVNCVHRRVFVFRVNANCDVDGYVERTGPVTLYGRSDRVYGAVPIYGAAEVRGANRFTSRIARDTEARVTMEIEAQPQLRRDWSLDLKVSDSFHWNEAPYIHILGRDISLAGYVEPRIREQLARVRARAIAAARRLDLPGKAATAWRRVLEPIKLADNPEVWLQVTPQSAAFAGVRASAKVLEGSLEITGTAETFVGHMPAPAAPTPLPPLGDEVAAPRAFEVVLPMHIGYDVLHKSIADAIAASPIGGAAIKDIQIYPSSGKLVVGLLIGNSQEPNAHDDWVYFSGAPKIDSDKKTIQLSDLTVAAGSNGEADRLLAQLRQTVSVSYDDASQKLLAAANQRLVRTLQNGFRMEGHLGSVNLDGVELLADGLNIPLRASGDLKIVYQP
jgi:hypothetical protein